MGGGLMQLVAYGAQDVYLTGNPQITFFKVVYRRHTNFSMEAIQQTMNGASTITKGGQSTVTVSRNGDLIHKVYACFEVPSDSDYLNGSSLFSSVDLEIGGQLIDRHYEEWNQVWNELSTPESKAIGLKAMIGDTGRNGSAGKPVGKTNYPFNFWFCRNPGLALPLIALQYHEVKLKLNQNSVDLSGSDSELAVIGNPTSGSPPSTTTIEIWVDYIYLDTDERRRFAQVSHEYLIDQLQKDEKTISGTGPLNHKLNFNHPVKELIWTYPGKSTMSKTTLKLNGHDRFTEQSNEEYFTLRQPFDYHTAIPKQNLPSSVLTNGWDEPILNHHTILVDGNATTPSSVAITEMTGATTTTLAATEMFFGQWGHWSKAGINQELAAADKLVAHTSTATHKLVVDGQALAVSTLAGSLWSGAGAPFTAGSAGTHPDVIATIGTQYVLTGYGTRWAGGGTNYATRTEITATLTWIGYGKAYTGASAIEGHPTETDGVLMFDVDLVTVGDTVAAGEVTIVGVQQVQPNSSTVGHARTSKLSRKTAVYSFCLKPEEHQPSGTCNFSRIDNAELTTTFSDAANETFTVYAVNYNVLRIMSGMGGLAYSN